MNRIVKFIFIIGILLTYLFLQSFIINKQQAEIIEAKDHLNKEYLEYDYFNNIELNLDSIALQEDEWNEMKEIITMDFATIAENFKESFQKKGWKITEFQRLEEEKTPESTDVKLIQPESNNLIRHQPISYEIHFLMEKGNFFFPCEVLFDVPYSIRIDSIKIIIDEEKSHGILHLTYFQQDLCEESILKL